MYLSILAVILLLAANAFFVAAEFALVKVRAIRLEALAAAGQQAGAPCRPDPQASRGLPRRLPARHHHGVPGPGLGRRAGGGGRAGAAVPARWAWASSCCTRWRSLLGFLLFSSLHIVIGEQVPKTFAIRQPEPISLWVAAPLHASSCCAGRSTGRSTCRSRAILRLLRRGRGQRPRGLFRRRAAPADRRLAPARRGAQAGARHAGRPSSTSRSSRSAR